MTGRKSRSNEPRDLRPRLSPGEWGPNSFFCSAPLWLWALCC